MEQLKGLILSQQVRREVLQMYDRGFTAHKIWLYIAAIMVVIVATLILTYSRFRTRSIEAEARSNLTVIRELQEAYFSERGTYGALAEMGFRPLGKTRYDYATTIGKDGKSFIITATGDVDKDGKKAVYTIDSTADTYPEVVKSGDNL